MGMYALSVCMNSQVGIWSMCGQCVQIMKCGMCGIRRCDNSDNDKNIYKHLVQTLSYLMVAWIEFSYILTNYQNQQAQQT